MILAISTSSPMVSIAVFDGSVSVYNCAELAPRQSSEYLFSMLSQADSQLNGMQLEAIAVDVGPGSFTGVRVGVMAAKTLAYLHRIKLLPLKSFELIEGELGIQKVVACKKGFWFTESAGQIEMIECIDSSTIVGYGDQIEKSVFPLAINAKLSFAENLSNQLVEHQDLTVNYGAEPRISQPKSLMGGLHS